jgi:hypothetical protein
MVAGMLHHLGVHMGDAAHPPVFEDQHLRGVVAKHDWRGVSSLAAGYSDSHRHWGFKWTVPGEPRSLLSRLNRVIGHGSDGCRNLSSVYRALGRPRVLLTFKDVFSIANRNRLSISADLLVNMERTVAVQQTIVEFLRREDPDALLISVDKAVHNKVALLDELTRFCDLSPTAQQNSAALAFIEPNSQKYLLSTKSDKCVGNLASLKCGRVHGWARYKHKPDVASVALYVNDEKVDCVRADQYRPDLVKKGHQTGKCAFAFDRFDVKSLQPGSVIRVRVEGDTQDLANSPQLFEGVA